MAMLDPKDMSPDMFDAYFNGRPQPDVRVACTTINAYGRDVTVSTINRDSSALYCPGRYAETIVFDNSTNPRKILDMGEACEGSRHTHDAMVIKWSREIIEDDDED
jgi:hypothetical protein